MNFFYDTINKCDGPLQRPLKLTKLSGVSKLNIQLYHKCAVFYSFSKLINPGQHFIDEINSRKCSVGQKISIKVLKGSGTYLKIMGNKRYVYAKMKNKFLMFAR